MEIYVWNIYVRSVVFPQFFFLVPRSILQFSQYPSSTLSLTFKSGEVVVMNYVSL